MIEDEIQNCGSYSLYQDGCKHHCGEAWRFCCLASYRLGELNKDRGDRRKEPQIQGLVDDNQRNLLGFVVRLIIQFVNFCHWGDRVSNQFVEDHHSRNNANGKNDGFGVFLTDN